MIKNTRNFNRLEMDTSQVFRLQHLNKSEACQFHESYQVICLSDYI